MSNVPKVRFKGFTDEWEERKLGELATFSKGQGFTKSDLTLSGTPIVLYGRLYTNYSTTISNIGDTFVEKSDHTVRSDFGDVIVPSSGETSIEIARASAILSKGIILGGDLNVIKPKMTRLNSTFLALIISNGKQQKKLSRLAQGKTVSHLNNSDLKSLHVEFPIIKEQEKISCLISTLENHIDLLKQDMVNKKQLKKAMLQKMFPQKGETVPKLRFDGFDGDWEERKLGELSNIVRGASPRPIQDKKWFDSESEIGWLRISDVTNQNGRITFLEQRISELGQAKTRVLEYPHLLLSIAATVGKPVINYVKTGVHDGFLIFLDIKFNQEFMFQWLDNFKPNWQKYGQPGSQVNLNSEIVKSQSIILPTLPEQQKIGAFFKSLDDQITELERQLEHTKQMKKALLQKMFV